MSLRSILGKSRVKKRRTASSLASPRASASPPTGKSKGKGSQNHRGSPARRQKGDRADDNNDEMDDEEAVEEEEEDFFNDKLDDHGLAAALATDLSLRDVTQAMRHIRAHMFAPIPLDRGGVPGMDSTRTARLLRARQAPPPLVTAAHVTALLGSATAAERGTAELVRAGTLKRIVVPRRRGEAGEMLIEVRDLESMVGACQGLEDDVRDAFLRVLREQPGAVAIDVSRSMRTGGLSGRQVDLLVRAGFLTLQVSGMDVSAAGLFSRPEDRVTLTSLERVSRAASGSIGAVGGEGAVHAAGGSGGKGGHQAGDAIGSRDDGDDNNKDGGDPVLYSIAMPGTGVFLKLASAALAHLTSLLAKSRYREAPESWLRQRWDGGLVAEGDDARLSARKARGGYLGVLPGRTKKWREFWGLSFEWVLGEAVGAGLVEMFETGSVGRGVRLR